MFSSEKAERLISWIFEGMTIDVRLEHTEEKYNYWHIGRFAIDSFAGISTLLLFKQLMVYAINPIIQSENSYMIAEVDIKLLKTLNILGIQTIKFGNSKRYLASETIPICSSREDLSSFYDRYKVLCRVL